MILTLFNCVSVLTSYPYFQPFCSWLISVYFFFTRLCSKHVVILLSSHLRSFHTISRVSLVLVSKAQRFVWQVLAVCIIQWERVRGCRSSVVLFLYWLLSVLCSLIPLRAKIQLAIEQVREMTHAPNLGHPFHGPVLKPKKTARSHTQHTRTH